ncbi:MAG: DNA polymerase II large subunit [Nanoarchaeota archaeon]
MEASKRMQAYFDALESECKRAYEIAKKARKKGYDPKATVEIRLAKNMAERVISLISVVAPQIIGTGAEERIIELEEEYGAQDWRIALVIAEEIAQEKFCKFKDQKESMEVGIRAGFTYATVGVVSSPLEGFTSLELKQRRDGKGLYFCLNYAGPIRNAGGTAAAFSVLLADYIRVKFGFSEYDPDERETKRTYVELEDYHEFVTNLQYFPSREEVEFLMQNLPVEISGDPSEKYSVSNVNVRDLPRVHTNQLRSGFCLIHSSCIPLKAPKLWKQLSDWGDSFGLGHWRFLEEFLKIQKKMKAHGKKKEAGLSPDYTFIHDLVAGRPVIGHPLANGSFRLRYGRSRTSGFSAQSIHPATMVILDNFVASATQLKTERPGKAAAYTPCDTIDGPIVKLQDGSVMAIQKESVARDVQKQVKEILYLGDVLVNYGDFFNRAHALVPPGYCPEFWVLELDEQVQEQTLDAIAQRSGLARERIASLLVDSFGHPPTVAEAFALSRFVGVPLHPAYNYFWNTLSFSELVRLFEYLRLGRSHIGEKKIILPYEASLRDEKRSLELIGLPHRVVNKEYVVIEKTEAEMLFALLGIGSDKEFVAVVEQMKSRLDEARTPLENMITLTKVLMKDRLGVFIGARMGRPEKAKVRKMVGSPHALFPVGSEGGRLRSFQSALEKKRVTAEFSLYSCSACKAEVTHAICPMCGSDAKKMWHCETCGVVEDCPHETKKPYKRMAIDIEAYFFHALSKLKTKIYPDLIKGVKGTSNREHVSECLVKGILRAKHEVFVNKDGTTRYDASEVTLTHFKPKEVRVPVERLRKLGYTTDIHGMELEQDDQVLELFPQDVVIPCCAESPDAPADAVLFNVANFVDELLYRLYGQKPYYRLAGKEDLVGQLIIGLAPHTSAGILGRIIGFSNTQAFLAHPYFHAAMRRDCFAKETYIPLRKNGVWQLEMIGCVVESLSPTKVVDSYGTREVKPEGYSTIGLVDGRLVCVPVDAFTKHAPLPMVSLKTHLGKRLRTTINHKHIIRKDGKDVFVRAEKLNVGDILKLPYNFSAGSRDMRKIDFLEELKGCDWLMVRGLKKVVSGLAGALHREGLSKQAADNFARRDSVPVKVAIRVMRTYKIDHASVLVAAKRDTVAIPAVLRLTDEFLQCIGLYIAEGFSRRQTGKKGSYQVYIAAERAEIRSFIRDTFGSFGLVPSDRKKDRVTYSSRILFELFTSILEAGKSAYEKRIPARLLLLPPKRLGKLLGGYLEGDGSVSHTDLRIVFDTVSEGLLHDMEFVFGRLGIFLKLRRSTRKPGRRVCAFYEKKGRSVPSFTCTRGIIQSRFVHKLSKWVSFLSKEKQERHEHILKNKRFRNLFCEYDDEYFYDLIECVEFQPPEESYCLTVENHHVVANGILTRQCDGDESCLFLLMDGLLNFSRAFLPTSRGSTMDAPLVLTYLLNPQEVDDMAFHMDTAWKYPLEFYRAAEASKMPWDVKVAQIGHVLGTPAQFEGLGFTHDTADFNKGVVCSAYKLLPSMAEKLKGQMALAVKIRAVNQSDVARLVIEKHFIRDTKGNLKKFSQQEFRCVDCNEKFRRPPLIGKCGCGGRLLFTISEGSVIKYLEASLTLAEKYNVAPYLKESLELTKRRIESVFGKEKEVQQGLAGFMG